MKIQHQTIWLAFAAVFAASAFVGSETAAQTDSRFGEYQGNVTVYSPIKEDPANEIPTVDPFERNSDSVEKSPLEGSIDYLQRVITPQSETASAGTSGFLNDPKAKRKAIQTGATLVLVLSVFMTLATFWKMRPSSKSRRTTTRRRRARPNQLIPESIVTVLGHVPFVHNQQLQLLRLGSRLLLVSVTQNGSQTLGEISDPNEVFEIENAFETGQFENLAAYFQNIEQPAGSHRQLDEANQTGQSSNRQQSGMSLGNRTQPNQYATASRTLLEA